MPRPLLSVIVLLALFIPFQAAAQYMYLDSNGDGVHTAADVLNAIGTTQVTVWLNSNHGRDGTEVQCPTSDGPMSVGSSFTVVLRATDGTFSCSNPTSLQPLLSSPFPVIGNDTEFAFSFIGPAYIGVGLFPLAHLTISVAGGTPSVEIVPLGTLGQFPAYTQFGTQCSTIDYDNTMNLGSDWFEVDGLPYSSGGSANLPPLIPPIPALNVAVGDVASTDVTVSDPDGDLIHLSLSAGPAFVSVTELSASPGVIAGRIHARPRRGDEGEYTASIAATDGSNQATRSASISVISSPNHAPAFRTPSRIDVVAETIARELLVAADADGDPLTFTKLSGPGFAAVQPGRNGRGGGTGFLLIRPSLCDIGSSSVVVSVSDGMSSSSQEIGIHVLAPSTVSNPVRSFPQSGRATAVATADFNEDGHIDAVTVGEFASGMSIFLGDGTGNLSLTSTLVPGSSSIAVAMGDWNHDGHSDIAMSAYQVGSLRVFPGRGDGSFGEPMSIPGISLSTNLGVGDWNGDAIDDLAVTSETNQVAILLGHAGSGLAPAGAISTLAASKAIAVGDFDLDGALDLAVTSYDRSSVLTLLFGRGDGTFGDRRTIANSTGTYPVAAGDWNTDGALDIAMACLDVGGTLSSLGDGSGNFSFSPVSPTTGLCFDMDATDWNADGLEDLIVTQTGSPAALLLGRGDGTFATSALAGSDNVGIALADLNEDGRPDLLHAQGAPQLALLLNTTSSLAGVLARAFTTDAKAIPMTSSSRTLCTRLEPLSGSFAALDVDGSTLRLVSEGTGSVSSIAAVATKQAVVGDTDHNGVAEYPACFAMSDLARLFDGLHGKQTVTARLQGSLQTGKSFCAPLSMTIMAGGGGALAARVEPNPLNPSGVLRFSLGKPAAVTVRLFDPTGRLVRTVWERRPTDPGEAEVPIDGRNAAGQSMATGIYFYRVEADGQSTVGRFSILK